MPYALQHSYSNQTFFDDFTFYTSPDASNGQVTYLPSPLAFSRGLAFWTTDGTPGIQADGWTSLEPGQKRDSVRLQSKAVWDGGLFVADFGLMPWGCGVWPAFWTLGYGAEWPLYEGIQDRTSNQATIHSTPGCVLDRSGGYGGITGETDCDSTSGKTGCGIVSPSIRSYGQPFNEDGGGVFVLLWDPEGIRIWEFPRNGIPLDISTETPNPGSWGLPSMAYDASTCDIGRYFKDNQLVLTVNLCGTCSRGKSGRYTRWSGLPNVGLVGDWAGGSYAATGHCPGTCAEQIADPANMKNTIWLINYIKVFQPVQPGQSPPPMRVLTAQNGSSNGQGVGGGWSVDGTSAMVPQEEGKGRSRGGAAGSQNGSVRTHAGLSWPVRVIGFIAILLALKSL